MSVTQVHEALGSFEFELLGNVPRGVLDGIDYFSHIAIIPGRMDPRQYGDGCLDAARYVGVVRSLKIADDGRTNLIQDDIRVGGVGMEFWLGDEDNKGYIIETAKEYTEESFVTVINDLLPASLTAGTIQLGETGETAEAAGTAATADYLVTSDEDAADLTVGDTFHLYDVAGFLKEGTIFTITSLESAFGFTNVVFSPNAAEVTETGDELKVGVFATYSGRHQYETPRSAIQYVCDTMSTESTPLGYTVSNAGVLDAGPEEDLYVTNPVCIIMRKGSTQGEDMFMRALPSTVDLDQDMEDFSTRVLMLAESDGENLATGSADIDTIAPGVNTFKDLFGNPLKLTRLVSESETTELWADTRAELALRGVIQPHRTLTISTEDYDIQGTFEVGDYIWVYDPDSGLFDIQNEVVIRGVRINPIKLRVTEADWPITEGYTVAHRDADGNWQDLTDYIHWEETQPTQVVVGEFNRSLTEGSQSITDRTGAVIPADNTIPDQVDWVPASFQTVNYLDGNNGSKARQLLVWDTPLNTNGTAITDGSHYELQYKLDTGSLYSQTWAAASTLSWDELNTWNQPVEPDDVQWQTLIVPWGDNSTIIHELPVGTGFDSRIRAVDKGNNQGAWSTVETWVTSQDNIPPSPPAAPVVAGNPLNIQVIHELGKASGGTFNLELDLSHLEVHYSQDEGFFPDDDTLAGRMSANRGMIAAGTAAIASFPIPETDAVYVKVVAVDTGGNKSSPSAAAQVTAELIDSQYISELTASKISAGTLSANVILGASIRTAESGARVELSESGLEAYNSTGTRTIRVDSTDGSVEIIGELASGTTGQRIVVNPEGVAPPQIRFYPTTGSNFALVRSYDSNDAGPDPSIMNRSAASSAGVYSLMALSGSQALLGRYVLESSLYRAQGGNINLTNTGAQLSYFDYGGTNDFGGAISLNATECTVGALAGTDEEAFWTMQTANGSLAAKGEMRAYNDPQGALHMGLIMSTGGPFSGSTTTYGPTYASAPMVVVDFQDNPSSAGQVFAHVVTGRSTTQFTTLFSSSSIGDGLTIMWWAWRMD